MLRRYNYKSTYVSHETRVQRPLLHPIEGPLCVAAWSPPGTRARARRPHYGLRPLSPRPSAFGQGAAFRMAHSVQLQATTTAEAA